MSSPVSLKKPAFLCLGLVCLFSVSCANFRKLGSDLKFIEQTRIASVTITNASEYDKVYGFLAEWDPEKKRVNAADAAEVGGAGLFGFFVDGSKQHLLAAISDENGNDRYDPGEPAWINRDENGELAAAEFGPDGKYRVEGKLSSKEEIPEDVLTEMRKYRGDRGLEETIRGWSIPVELGTIADLDDEKFSSERGAEGLWEPASFPLEDGIGIYFLEEYDPSRTPIIFVYGAAGSPQDWRTFFDSVDRDEFQCWFYYYPTGRRLQEMGEALDRGIRLLQARYDFDEVNVVAHSMGGLVSRAALIEHAKGKEVFIDDIVTISTPWAGHEAAEMGVKHAPAVVPSWLDMQTKSDFQRDIFGPINSRSFRGYDHLLIYGTKASGSMFLPDENDGTVSVASQTAPPAMKTADETASFEEDRFHEATRGYLGSANQVARHRAALLSGILLVLMGATVFLMWYGSQKIQDGELTPGEFTSFMFFLGFLGNAGGLSAQLAGRLHRMSGAAERVADLLDQPVDNVKASPSGEEEPDIPRLQGEVEFRKVSFSYPEAPDQPVLKDLDLHLKPRTCLAVTGPSGAGKSTLTSLLFGLFNPTSGDILIDGKKLQDYPLTPVRRQMAIAPQEAFLFAGTVAENIAYGRPNASPKEIEAAARQANAWEFISELPDGLNTVIGDRGTTLSGGQRQRLSIARAVLCDPAILVMDEAASALDAESERLVQEATNEIVRDRTTLIIAHRLSTLRQADEIAVLRDGKIVERGTHEQLYEASGFYRQLCEDEQQIVPS